MASKNYRTAAKTTHIMSWHIIAIPSMRVVALFVIENTKHRRLTGANMIDSYLICYVFRHYGSVLWSIL